jgi:hypothetical protein
MAITRLARFDARKLDTIRSGLDRGENDSSHEDTKATSNSPGRGRSFFFEIFFRPAC